MCDNDALTMFVGVNCSIILTVKAYLHSYIITFIYTYTFYIAVCCNRL